MDRAFNQSLSKQNIKARFKTIGIWPLNPRVMDHQNRPNKPYIVESNLDISNDEDGQLEGAVNGNQWGKDRVAVELINIITTSQNESESTQNDLVQSTT